MLRLASAVVRQQPSAILLSSLVRASSSGSNRYPKSPLKKPNGQRFKVLRTDRELSSPEIDAGLVDTFGVDLKITPDGIPEEELIKAMKDIDLLLMCYTPITAKVIAAAPNLKAIVKYGVGIDAIDIDAAKARKVPVVNVPEYAERTVAEGAFAMMISLAKKMREIGHKMDREGWTWPTPDNLGWDLSGKTLAIVGTGRIGKSMAQMGGAGFGMRVLGYDPNQSAAKMKAAGIEKCDNLISMLRQADFVSVHASLSSTSKNLIGRAEFAAMKPTAFFVNSARGALVVEEELLKALQEKRIAGAGIDVFSSEPINKTTHLLAPLLSMENVILHPHLTFYTEEAMQRLTDDTLDRCYEVLTGAPVTIKSRDPRLISQTSGVRIVPTNE